MSDTDEVNPKSAPDAAKATKPEDVKRELPVLDDLALRLVELGRINTVLEDADSECLRYLPFTNAAGSLRLEKAARTIAWTAPLMVRKRGDRWVVVGRLRQAYFLKQFLNGKERVPAIVLRDESGLPDHAADLDILMWLLVYSPTREAQLYAAKLLGNSELVNRLSRGVKASHRLTAALLGLDSKTARSYSDKSSGTEDFDEE